MGARRLSAIVARGGTGCRRDGDCCPPGRPDRCRAAGLRGLDSRRPDPNVGSRQPRQPRRSGLETVRGGTSGSRAQARARNGDNRPVPAPPTDGRLRARLESRCRPAFCAAPVRGVRSRAVASWAHGAAVLRRRPPVPRHAFRLPRLLLRKGRRARGRSKCHRADVTRRPGRPSRRLPERPHGGPANPAPGSVDTLSRSSAESRTSHNSRHWFKGSQRGCGAPFRAWRFAATTRSSTTTRRPARGSRTGRSTPAQPSSSPQQAIARSARSRPPAFAACGASRAGEDLSYLGPHILASASQRYDRLVELTVSWYLEGRLPPGGDVELGLVDDAVALVGINPDVPPVIRAKVAQEAARLRAQEVRQPG